MSRSVTPLSQDGRRSRGAVRSDSNGGILDENDIRHYKAQKMPLPGSTRRKHLEKTQFSSTHDANKPGVFSPRSEGRGVRTVIASLQDTEAVTLYHGVRRKLRIPLERRVAQVVFNQAEAMVLTVDGQGITAWRDNALCVPDPCFAELAGVKRVLCALQSSQYIALCDGDVIKVLDAKLSTMFAVTSPRPCSSGEYNQSSHGLVSCGGRHILVWDFVKCNKELRHRSTIALSEKVYPNHLVSFVHLEMKKSRSQRCFAAVHRSILVYTLHTGELIATLKNAHTRAITCVLFNRMLSYLCSASCDGSIHVWDESYALLHTFCGHAAAVVSLRPYPHGPLIISASHDETIRVWNLLNGQEVDRLPTGHPVHGLASHANVEMFASISPACLDIWKMNYIYYLLTPIDIDIGHVYHSQHPEVPMRLVLHCADSTVRLLSPESGDILTTALLPLGTSVVASAYEAKQERLYVLTGDGVVERFDIAKESPATKIAPWPVDELSDITSLCLYEFVMDKESLLEASDKDRWFAVAMDAGHFGHVGSAEKTLFVAGNSQGKLLFVEQGRKNIRVSFSVRAHSSAVHHIVCSPKLDRLVSGSREDRNICIWRVFPFCEESLALLRRVTLVQPPSHLALCQQSLCVAWNHEATADFSLTMLDIMTKERFSHSPDVDHADSILNITSLDSLGLFATASVGGDVRIWTLENELVRSIHLNAIPQSVSFCSYQGDLAVAIQGHMYKINSSMYLPKQMLQMTLAVSMAVCGVESARPLAGWSENLEDCDRSRLIGLATSVQRYTPGNLDDETASVEDTEEWREGQLMKRQMELHLLERDTELEQLRDGTFVYERKRLELTARQKKAAWRAFYSQIGLRSKPNVVISEYDSFDYDGQAAQFFSTEVSAQPDCTTLSSAKKFFPPLSTFEPPYPVAPSGYLPNSVLLKAMRKSAEDQAAVEGWKPKPLTEEQLAALAAIKKPIIVEEEEEEVVQAVKSNFAQRLKGALDAELEEPEPEPEELPPTPPPEPVKEKKAAPRKPIVKLIAPKAKVKSPPPRSPTPPREPTPPPPPEKIPDFIRRHLHLHFMRKLFPGTDEYNFPPPHTVDGFVQKLIGVLASAPTAVMKIEIVQVLDELCKMPLQDQQTKPMVIDALLAQILASPADEDSTGDFSEYQTLLVKLLARLGVSGDTIVAQLTVRYLAAASQGGKATPIHQLVLLGLVDEPGYFARELDSWTVEFESVEGLVKASQRVNDWLASWISKHAAEAGQKGKNTVSLANSAGGRRAAQKSGVAAIDAINYFVRYTLHQEELARLRALNPTPQPPPPPPPRPPTPDPQTTSQAVVALPAIGLSSLARYGITHCSKCHPERESTLHGAFPLPPIHRTSRHQDCLLHGFPRRITLPLRPKTLVLEDSDDEDSGIGESQSSSTSSIFNCKKHFVLDHTLLPEMRRR